MTNATDRLTEARPIEAIADETIILKLKIALKLLRIHYLINLTHRIVKLEMVTKLLKIVLIAALVRALRVI